MGKVEELDLPDSLEDPPLLNVSDIFFATAFHLLECVSASLLSGERRVVTSFQEARSMDGPCA